EDLTSGDTAEGNVKDNDQLGADSRAEGGAVVGVALGDSDGEAVSGNVGTAIEGSHGTLTLNADGSFSYVANANATGSDVFTYTIEDADGDQATATLTVGVVDGSVEPIDTSATVYEAGLDGGTDVGDQTITASGDLDLAEGWSAVATNGTTANGSYVINANGSYSYTLTAPADHSEGEVTDVIEYTTTDEFGNTQTNTLTINIFDDEPVPDIRNVIFQNSAGFSFEGTAVQMGADQEGAQLIWTQAPTGLSYEGVSLEYEGVGTNTLLAYVGEGEDRIDVFQIVGNPDGSYVYEQFQPIDLVTTEIRDFTAGDFSDAGGPEPNVYILEDGTLSRELSTDTLWAVEISGIGGQGGNADQINSNANGVGVGTPTFSNGEYVTFDFDLDGSSGGADLFSSASIEFSATSGIAMDYVVTYSDGTEVAGSFLQGDLIDQTFTFDAPSGLFLDSIVLHNQGGGTQITGFGVSQIVELIDEGLPFDVGFEAVDGDGDTQDGVIDFYAEPGQILDASGDLDGVILVGDEGDNELIGGIGDDILYGGAGNDTITGGEGNDTIIGGAGDDELTGGGGNNVFVWHLGDQGADGSVATDTVTDFTLDGDGADKLVLSDLLQDMESADDLSSYVHAVEDGDNTILHISAAGELSVEEGSISGADQVIVLSNVDMGEMDSGQFLQSLIESGQLDIE
ncbi:Ig-like domain-containing protein, partial [Halomonas campaniensis]|uniref:Ig-like domain-containing protein n=1 Tax=Halomonas campaniensis TaxID=213554 RepID=UPI00356671DE